MEIRIDFTLIRPEFGATVRQLFRRQLWLFGVLRWFVICLLMGVVLALVGLSSRADVDLGRPAAFVFAAALIALPFSLAALSLRVGRKIAPSFLEPTTVVFSDERIEVRRETFAGSGSWKYFAAWKELPTSLVLEHFPGTILVVPKRAISPDTLPRLRELLTQKLGPAKTV